MEGISGNAVTFGAFAFLVALLYSSVGHGGASGYLALLYFYSFSQDQMATSALCLNLLVSAVAFRAFFEARHFCWNLTWPFVIASLPAAFLGGLIRVPLSVYSLLLSGTLIAAGVRLILRSRLDNEDREIQTPPLFFALVLGGGIGLLSGMVGVGGGIFLSPLLLFLKWADPKKTAGTSAFFIFANSLAGLLGRIARHHFDLNLSSSLVANLSGNLASGLSVPSLLILSAFLGGILGSRLGATRITSLWLKRVLAVVLFAASLKLFRSV